MTGREVELVMPVTVTCSDIPHRRDGRSAGELGDRQVGESEFLASEPLPGGTHRLAKLRDVLNTASIVDRRFGMNSSVGGNSLLFLRLPTSPRSRPGLHPDSPFTLRHLTDIGRAQQDHFQDVVTHAACPHLLAEYNTNTRWNYTHWALAIYQGNSATPQLLGAGDCLPSKTTP